MTSPPDWQRLSAAVETRQQELRDTWTAISHRGQIPLETLRRARLGKRPLTEENLRRLEMGLRWAPGSADAVLDGGDPAPLPSVPHVQVEEHVLDTAIGQVTYQIAPLSDADGVMSAEELQELEEDLAERLRTEIPLFVEMRRRELAKRKREKGEG